MSPPATNSARAPTASTGMGDMPPVPTSAEALLVALAVEAAVALEELMVALWLALALELALAMPLCIALEDISGQTPSGSNAVWSFVPKSTLPSSLK
jgi:hypothetical protein